MSFNIITDSGSEITQEEATKLGIKVIPLKVIFKDKTYYSGVDITNEEFYNKLIESSEFPKTSQINPFEFEEEFKKVKEAGEKALVITISSKLSGTYQSAMIARQGYEDCIEIVDSLNVCIGEEILVKKALKLRDLDIKEAAAILNEAKKRIRVLALLDTLEYLYKGGRISKIKALTGALFAIKPVVAVVNGAISMEGKARGSKNGKNLLSELVNKSNGIDFNEPYALGYSGFSNAVLKKHVMDNSHLWQGYEMNIPNDSIGPTIGCHVGPNAIACAFFEKE